MSWEKIQDMHLTEEENEKFYATESQNRIKFYVFHQWRYAKLAVTANEYLKVVSIVVTTENFGKIKNSVMILNK